MEICYISHDSFILHTLSEHFPFLSKIIKNLKQSNIAPSTKMFLPFLSSFLLSQ